VFHSDLRHVSIALVSCPPPSYAAHASPPSPLPPPAVRQAATRSALGILIFPDAEYGARGNEPLLEGLEMVAASAGGRGGGGGGCGAAAAAK